jgi:transposase
VRLANTAAIKQYDGLKHGDDFSDGKHLAQLLRLVDLAARVHLPTGASGVARPVNGKP